MTDWSSSFVAFSFPSPAPIVRESAGRTRKRLQPAVLLAVALSAVGVPLARYEVEQVRALWRLQRLADAAYVVLLLAPRSSVLLLGANLR